jgi:hypothetical protein
VLKATTHFGTIMSKKCFQTWLEFVYVSFAKLLLGWMMFSWMTNLFVIGEFLAKSEIKYQKTKK